MPTAHILYRPLHAGQLEIAQKLGPRNLLRCGRRFGKTELLQTVFGHRAAYGRRIGWMTPDYKLQRPTYNTLHRLLKPMVTHASKTEGVIELIGGGGVEFWTLDNEDAGRSRSYDDVVIDEASLKKKGLKEIVEQAIGPTLLDRRGTLTIAGTPKGIDPENFFYEASQVLPERLKWKEFWAPTRNNLMLDPVGVAALETEHPPLVYKQEYLAEFVDWSGIAFFTLDKLLMDGLPVEYPSLCDYVYATIDTAIKTGKENDGTAVTFWALNRLGTQPYPLTVLDWDYIQIEGASLEEWLPTVFERLEHFARVCKARQGSAGAFIEDKGSGTILLQQAQRRGWNSHAIESDLTAMGKVERALNISSYVFRGWVKLSTHAFTKTCVFKGVSANHLVNQITGFRVDDKELVNDDAVDSWIYGVAIGLGNEGGF